MYMRNEWKAVLGNPWILWRQDKEKVTSTRFWRKTTNMNCHYFCCYYCCRTWTSCLKFFVYYHINVQVCTKSKRIVLWTHGVITHCQLLSTHVYSCFIYTCVLFPRHFKLFWSKFKTLSLKFINTLSCIS